MTMRRSGYTLGRVLTELGAEPSIGPELASSRLLAGSAIWFPGTSLPDVDHLLICPTLVDTTELTELMSALADNDPRVILIPGPVRMTAEELGRAAYPHEILALPFSVNAADVVAEVTHAATPAEETASRRLASLQRSLSQALGEQSPVPALLNRVKKATNAAVGLLDADGNSLHTTEPIPLAKLYEDIRRTNAESQTIDIDGWHGIATRVSDPGLPDQRSGWLVAVSRRQGFPNAYSTSAVHIAASLIEASQRMAAVARSQERAVRSAVLSQALNLQPVRDDPELSGRMASLGITFTEDLRVLAVRPLRSPPRGHEDMVLQELALTVERAFKAVAVMTITLVRDGGVAALAACSAASINRVFTSQAEIFALAHVGVGRDVASIGDIAESYHDAQLAVRALRRNSQSNTPTGLTVMSYENFDFATRLFADVGLDKIAARAHEFLQPLEDREVLSEGLQTYFEHGQNINAAADALNIHHNSLRYRLSKIESLLNLSFKDPAAVSSTWLALTALELTRQNTHRLRRPAGGAQDHPSGSARNQGEAPRTVTEIRSRAADTGVVHGPDH